MCVSVKERKLVLRHRDDISLDYMTEQLGDSLVAQNVNEGHYLKRNEDNILNKMCSSYPEKKKLDADIIKNVSARKRNKLRALFLYLKQDQEELDLDELADFEIACFIDNDKKVSDYLERINSRRLYHQDKKHLTKRETMIKFLDDNYVWGIEHWDYSGKSLFESVISNFDNCKLIRKHHSAQLLGFNDVILCRDLFNDYKKYVEDNGYKPRQIAKLKEFNSFMLQHTIKHKVASTTENAWWNNDCRLTKNDEQKYYYCWVKSKNKK